MGVKCGWKLQEKYLPAALLFKKIINWVEEYKLVNFFIKFNVYLSFILLNLLL